ncbi:MAG TPA: NAD(P)H-dependent oxidoreductase [Lutibacter sp.]|nr:NAD(P)H-dependent oxidoreductase [Lutibacter sp.]
MKKILIINGHPDRESLCFALAESYKKGADTNGDQCQLVHLIDLKFNPILTYGYRIVSELEPDLLKIQQDILQADHLVFVYPNWWATFPALLKGFIDRIFLPNFAFKYHEKGPLWDKLLKGKTARLIVTMDTPKWYYWLMNRNAGHHAMKIGVLEFCGIKPVKISVFAPVKSSNDLKRKKWLDEVETLGRNQK